MRRFATLAASTITALAVLAPIAPATAAPTVTTATSITTADRADAVTTARKARKVRMKTKPRSYSHYGQRGVKVIAVFGKGSKGKAKFIVNGKVEKKVKVKRGKAAFRMSASAQPGVYKIKAKLRKRVGKTKVRVHNSSLTLSGVEFSISKAALSDYSYEVPDLTGTVIFKGKAPSQGFVDIYQDGKNKGGSSSPNYCCMSSVTTGGAFSFSEYSFLRKVAEEKPVGTYQYQAFYTPTASFDEYIYSSWITVHVVP